MMLVLDSSVLQSRCPPLLCLLVLLDLNVLKAHIIQLNSSGTTPAEILYNIVSLWQNQRMGKQQAESTEIDPFHGLIIFACSEKMLIS